MGRGLLEAARPLVRIACDAVTVLGLAGLALLLALDRLPVLLPAVLARIVPELRLEASAMHLDGIGRLAMRGVRLRTAAGEPILAAKRVVIRFSPWSLRRGHVDGVLLDRPLVTPAALTRGGGDGAGGAWSIGRLVTRGGRFHLPAHEGVPAVSFRFVTDLRDLGSTPHLADRVHAIDVKDLRLTPRGAAPLLAARGARAEVSLAGATARRHVEAVVLRSPTVTLTGSLLTLAGTDATGGDGPAWSLGRLVVRDGRFAMPAAADRPGVAFRVTADLRELDPAGDPATRVQTVTARRVVATLAGGAPVLAADAVVARFSLAGLLGKRIEEVRLVTPAITIPDTEPAAGSAQTRGAAVAAPAPGWSVGRLVTHDASIRVAAVGDRMPGLVGTISFDFRELGADPARAARSQRLRLRDVRVRLARRPTSLVVDKGSVDFTVAGVLSERRIARLRVDRGLLVLDRALREWMGTGSPGSRPPTAVTPWSVAVLDVAALGIRLSDLGPEIPDLTLFIRSRLTDVPLGPEGLARASTPQRVELSNITLDSPLDPFRPVVHVGSVFVDFTIAELLHRRIGALVVVSPTIYLGEDLIWYMTATRAEAATAPGAEAWTARRLRVELGRLVLTFNGVDRAALPLNFRTDAQNVVLGDLATLRLAAALEVPRQSYRFPGFDLDLIDVEGELRFDYPPGQASDNVVNTLRVSEIRWRDYRIRHGWFSATFDQRGVNGTLGGAAYDGYVNGGASLPFRPGPMEGWASCTDLDLAPLAAAAAGTYLEMEGLVDLEGTVEMQAGRIAEASASLDFTRPGRLSFPALDRLLERLPPGSASWQRDLARLAVETFRDYPYDSGKGTLHFADVNGEAHLGLDGERGKRQFDVYYHDQVTPPLVRTAREGE